MYSLVLKNKKGTYGEIITDFDLDSFKYEYEKNNERSIEFTVYKTSKNGDIFDNILNEMIVIWKDQQYVIKSTSIKYDGATISNTVTAKHIFMEFQNHYIEKNIQDGEMDSGEGDDESKLLMTLKQYLDYGFKNNNLGFNYKIKGNFKNRKPIEELGNKNGMEFITEGVDIFGYVYYANNKTIYFYDEDSFYKMADMPLIYHYNSSEVQASTSTAEVRTYIKGYGKKKTKAETKNYNPIKPKDLDYYGDFIKEGTWRTEKVGASYSKTFKCKWGNERLDWTFKRMSKGGMVDVYLDDEYMGHYNAYSKNAKSERIVIANSLSRGSHTFKAVFKGASKNVDYKKSNPSMYVGTEKSTVLNLTAMLKGKDIYHTYSEYKSPNYDAFGHSQAPTIFDDTITTKKELEQKLKQELNDKPTVELSTNYLGSVDDKYYLNQNTIKDNNMIRFIHKPLSYNVDLKVVKLTESHPLTNRPAEVDFSNAPEDIIKIQQRLTTNIKKMNRRTTGGYQPSFSMPENYSDIVGVTLVDD